MRSVPFGVKSAVKHFACIISRNVKSLGTWFVLAIPVRVKAVPVMSVKNAFTDAMFVGRMYARSVQLNASNVGRFFVKSILEKYSNVLSVGECTALSVTQDKDCACYAKKTTRRETEEIAKIRRAEIAKIRSFVLISAGCSRESP